MAGIDFVHQNGVDYEIVPEIAELFSVTKAYHAGDHVIHEAGWYTFKVDKSAGAWDAAKVDGPFKVSEQLTNLRGDLYYSIPEFSSALKVTKGKYIGKSNGIEANSSRYARTNLFGGARHIRYVTMTDTTYEYAVFYYGSTGSLDGTGYIGSSEYTQGVIYIPSNAVKIGISFRVVGSARYVTDDDLTAFLSAINAYAVTDKDLVLNGIPSDAKVTGELFKGVIASRDFGSFKVVSGYYSMANGNEYSDAHYARTKYKGDDLAGKSIYVTIGNGYKVAMRFWDNTNAFNADMATKYFTNTLFYVPEGYKIAFNFESADESELDANDLAAITQAFHVFIPAEADQFDHKTLPAETDLDTVLGTGTYRIDSSHISTIINAPTTDYGRLIVFDTNDNYSCVQIYVTYKNEIYTRILQYRDTNVWSSWGLVYNEVTGGVGAYLHDGEILRMSSNPDAIPVGQNHLGYTAFMAATWETLLPDDYTDGDAYDADTTKIINVHVSRESDWQSTAYGSNTDTYPIYRYTFTPIGGYKKTIFLSAGCHGNEAEGYWGLYRLMRMIYFEQYKYPTLRNLRDNVRFIIVPCWNPWGMEHYRRFNAFENKNLQAWNWLYAEDNKITVDNVEYDITNVGEAEVIWDTINNYSNVIDLWIDMHTDPYAGRTTSAGEIDDPRGYTQPYGFYGFVRKNTVTKDRLLGVMEDFYNILINDYSFAEKWHLPTVTASPTGAGGFSTWMASMPFKTALVEVSTFMQNFPYVSGSAGMMKMAQEYYANCLTEMLR